VHYYVIIYIRDKLLKMVQFWPKRYIFYI